MTNTNNAPEKEGQSMRQSARRVTLRTKIMRRIVAPFFVVLAVLSVALGVANATFWKPNDVVIAYAQVTGTRYIVTDPGVLNLVDSKVRVSVAALRTRKPICVAVGLTKDVRGWVAGSPVQRITGLKDWNNLSVSEMSGKSTLQQDFNTDIKDADVKFQQSNLWSSVTCQIGLAKLPINTYDYVQTAGSASYDHAVATGAVLKSGKNSKKSSNRRYSRSMRARSQAARRVLLIDLGDNVPAASVELRWRRHQVPDFATPLYFVGALFAVLALLAATIFAMAPHRRRNKQLAANSSGLLSKQSKDEEVTFSEAFSGTVHGMLTHKKHKKASGSHARHGCHTRRGKNPVENQNIANNSDSKQINQESPSSQVSSEDSIAQTTVISKDDMLAFAARFIQQHDDGEFAYELPSDEENSESVVDESSDLNDENLKNSYSETKDDAKNNQDLQSARVDKNRKNSQTRRNQQNKKNSRNRQDRQDRQEKQEKQDRRDKQDSQGRLGKQENQNKQSKSTKQTDNSKKTRGNRRGYNANSNNSRYRKNNKGYRGNFSSERGNKQ